jgi:hypothetical protein
LERQAGFGNLSLFVLSDLKSRCLTDCRAQYHSREINRSHGPVIDKKADFHLAVLPSEGEAIEQRRFVIVLSTNGSSRAITNVLNPSQPSIRRISDRNTFRD